MIYVNKPDVFGIAWYPFGDEVATPREEILHAEFCAIANNAQAVSVFTQYYGEGANPAFVTVVLSAERAAMAIASDGRVRYWAIGCQHPVMIIGDHITWVEKCCPICGHRSRE